jgi:hypothetical protein
VISPDSNSKKEGTPLSVISLDFPTLKKLHTSTPLGVISPDSNSKTNGTVQSHLTPSTKQLAHHLV